MLAQRPRLEAPGSEPRKPTRCPEERSPERSLLSIAAETSLHDDDRRPQEQARPKPPRARRPSTAAERPPTARSHRSSWTGLLVPPRAFPFSPRMTGVLLPL